MEFFAILTLEIPGHSTVSSEGVVSLTGPSTRKDIFNYMRNGIITENGPQYAKANVIFFNAEPNSIGS